MCAWFDAYGTPTEVSDAAIAITIPAAQLVTSSEDLGVNSNTNAKYAIEAVQTPAAASATVADVTISGTQNAKITDQEVTVTLEDDTFEADLSGNWITNLPAGLSQSVSRTDDTTAKITISGTP